MTMRKETAVVELDRELTQKVGRLIRESAVRRALQTIAKDMRLSREFLEGLDAEVWSLLWEAVGRAEMNGRKTLKAYDL